MDMKTKDSRTSRYREVYARWQRDPFGFWAEAAADIDWFEKPKKVFDPAAGIYGRWFVGGVCNTCFNAVDRHVNAGRGEQPAIIYDSPLAGLKHTLTYHRLLTETQVFGGMLRDLGVAVIERESNDRRVKPRVDRIEHAARHGDPVMGLKHRRRVGQDDGDRVAALDAAAGQRRCKASRARIKVLIGKTSRAVNDGRLVGIDRRGARQKR